MRQGYFTQNVDKMFHNWIHEIQGDPGSWSVPAQMHFDSHGNDKAQVAGELPPNLAHDPKCECRDVSDEAYFDGRVADLAVRALEERKAEGKPFFLAVGFWKPHSPFNAPKKYWDLYRREEVDLPSHSDWPKEAPRIAWHDSRELLGSNEKARKLTDDAVREIRHGYLANISYMDAQVGKVLHALDRLALTDRTVIVFWSDHGLHLGEQLGGDAEVNVVGSLNVMEGARAAGARKMVFASSGGTIYGEPDPSDLPVRESHPQQPLSPYGVAKKVVGDYLFAYRALHDLEFTALALANVYGPRQDPHGEAGVVAIFTGRLLADEPCTAFGDGTQTRDFVYVDDVVDAFVRAADKGSGLLANIGTGREVSVNELYQTMAAAAGVDRPAERAPARVGELARSALDPGRVGIHLGWSPWTTLEVGTTQVIDWFRARR